MLKIITKTLLLSAVTLGSTSYFMSAADAEPKFVFRYVNGGSGVVTGGGANNGGGTPPELPVEPENPSTSSSLEYIPGGRIRIEPQDDGSLMLSGHSYTFRNNGTESLSNLALTFNIGHGYILTDFCPSLTSISAGASYTCPAFNHTVSASDFEQFKDHDAGVAVIEQKIYESGRLLFERPVARIPLPSIEEAGDYELINNIKATYPVYNYLATGETVNAQVNIRGTKDGKITAQPNLTGQVTISKPDGSQIYSSGYSIPMNCGELPNKIGDVTTCQFDYTLADSHLAAMYAAGDMRDNYVAKFTAKFVKDGVETIVDSNLNKKLGAPKLTLLDSQFHVPEKFIIGDEVIGTVTINNVKDQMNSASWKKGDPLQVKIVLMDKAGYTSNTSSLSDACTIAGNTAVCTTRLPINQQTIDFLNKSVFESVTDVRLRIITKGNVTVGNTAYYPVTFQ